MLKIFATKSLTAGGVISGDTGTGTYETGSVNFKDILIICLLHLINIFQEKLLTA